MEAQNTLPATLQPAPVPAAPIAPAAPPSYFADLTAFEACQRMAKLLAASDLVPKAYQGNIANTTLALEVALQTGISPFFVMQNLNIIQGKPSWAAQIVAGMMNASRRFKGCLRYEMDDDENPTRCRVWAIDAATGERLNGPAVTLEMARKEGWTGRNGSKWQTMPEVMLGYRAVTFFARRHAPDLLLGLRTDDEIRDMGADEPPAAASKAQAIDALIEAQEKKRADLVAAGRGTPQAAEGGRPLEEGALCRGERGGSKEALPTGNPENESPVCTGSSEPTAYHKQEAPSPRGRAAKRPGESRPGDQPPALAQEAPQPAPAPADPPADQPPEEYLAMLRYIKELDDKAGMSLELRGWANRHRDKLLNDLGGLDSEWFAAVIEHWQELVDKLPPEYGNGKK